MYVVKQTDKQIVNQIDMSNKLTPSSVPMGQKIAFGIGMFANQMFPAILGIFMVVLVENLGFSGWMWSLIFLFPRFFDAITDPVMGFISDNTKSKWVDADNMFLQEVSYGDCLHLLCGNCSKKIACNTTSGISLVVIGLLFGLTLFSVPYVPWATK